jgi:hypothetical protein
MLLRLVTEQRNAALAANDAGVHSLDCIRVSIAGLTIEGLCGVGVAVGSESVSVLYAALRALWLTIDVAGLAFAPQYVCLCGFFVTFRRHSIIIVAEQTRH